MEFNISLDVDDWEKYRIYCERELPKRISHWSDRWATRLGLWLALVVVLTVLLLYYRNFDWFSGLIVAAFFGVGFAYLLVFTAKVKCAYRPSPRGPFIGTHHFRFENDRLVSSREGYHASHDWAAINRIERGDDMILIFLDTAIAIVLPEHKLSDPEAVYTEALRLHRLALEQGPS